jgi:hypothetical protein
MSNAGEGEGTAAPPVDDRDRCYICKQRLDRDGLLP